MVVGLHPPALAQRVIGRDMKRRVVGGNLATIHRAPQQEMSQNFNTDNTTVQLSIVPV